MRAIARRALIVGASALAATLGASAYADDALIGGDEVAIGAAQAPVTLIEYGSAMCGHCRAFEEACWNVLKSEYIDAGKVRFVFREMLAPVSPDGSGTIEAITVAMYQIARCDAAPPEQYFARLGALFARQPAIYQSSNLGEVRDHLIAAGAAAGLTQAQSIACMNDTAGDERIQRLAQLATQDNVTGTPTFFLDGRRLGSESMMTPDGLRTNLNAAIAAKS